MNTLCVATNSLGWVHLSNMAFGKIGAKCTVTNITGYIIVHTTVSSTYSVRWRTYFIWHMSILFWHMSILFWHMSKLFLIRVSILLWRVSAALWGIWSKSTQCEVNDVTYQVTQCISSPMGLSDASIMLLNFSHPRSTRSDSPCSINHNIPLESNQYLLLSAKYNNIPLMLYAWVTRCSSFPMGLSDAPIMLLNSGYYGNPIQK